MRGLRQLARELIDRYAPSVLWNDVCWPAGGDLAALFAHYYNTVDDGVINDRWLQPSGPRNRLTDAVTSGLGELVQAAWQHLPERCRDALLELCDAGAATLATWSKPTRRKLLNAVKDLRLPCARSRGYAHAEVTRGGVALDEVDARTMQSKLRNGLFVCGELLDVDGPIGGFNFQAAFATGRLAGLHA